MSSIIRADRWQNSNGVAYNSVLQVVSTTKTDTFSHATNAFTDITGMSVSITPFFSTSRILVQVTMSASSSASTVGSVKLVRGSTDIFIGDAAGSRTRATAQIYEQYGSGFSFTFLDSPATTSSTTYKIQARANDNASAFFVNRSSVDTDSAVWVRTASSITVMEIAQ